MMILSLLNLFGELLTTGMVGWPITVASIGNLLSSGDARFETWPPRTEVQCQM